MIDTLEVAKAIEERLAEARDEIASLEAARAAMTAKGPGGTPAPSRKPARQAARPRAASTVVPAAVEELLEGRDGVTSATLAEMTGGHRLEVLTLLRKLEAQGRVRRSGQRRGTRWHLIAD